ncbi:MAG: hypothetical protein ABH881_04085 [bacterium]
MRTPASLEQKNKPSIRKETPVLVLFFIQYFNIIALGVALLIFILLMNFVLWPMYVNVSREAQSSNKYKIEIQESQEKYIKKLFEYEDLYNEISLADKNKINTALRDNNHTEDLFPQIGELISKTGMILTSMSIVASESASRAPEVEKTKEFVDAEDLDVVPDVFPSEIGRIDIGISLEKVNYQGLKKLLAVLENNLMIMDVENLSFNLESEIAQLRIVSYFLLPPEQENNVYASY